MKCSVSFPLVLKCSDVVRTTPATCAQYYELLRCSNVEMNCPLCYFAACITATEARKAITAAHSGRQVIITR